MKLIKHIIPVDIDLKNKLLINSLNGLIDQVDVSVYNTISKWRLLNEIHPENELEVALLENLKLRGYLVEDDDEEIRKKEEIISVLRKKHADNRGSFKHVTFVMTYNCNFRCPYCFEGDKVLKKEVISNDQIDAALALAGSDLQSIGLFGGEPLLPATKPALLHLISRSPDVSYSVTTNGYHLDEFIDILAPLKINQIIVTLDGPEEVHDSRRYLANGKPTYKKIMSNVKLYLERNLPIHIRMNVDPSTIEEGIAFRNNLIQSYSKYGDKLTFEISSMLGGDSRERSEVAARLYREDAACSLDEKRDRNNILGRYSPIVNALTVGSQIQPIYSFCYAHRGNRIVVDPFGKIYPCLAAVGIEGFEIGTYFPEIYFKENGIHDRNVDTIPQCKECTYSLLCGGGCPVALPDYSDICKPVCGSIHSQIHDILPRICRIDLELETKSG